MTIFQEKLLTRTDCGEAGDYVVPNVLSPREQVFRPDIGHKLYYHRGYHATLASHTIHGVRRNGLHFKAQWLYFGMKTDKTVRATKSGRDLPLERKSLHSKIGDLYF